MPDRPNRFSFQATLLLLLLTGLVTTLAQADVVVLTSGEEIVGRIVQEDFGFVVLSTSRGEMRLNRRHISDIRRAPGSPMSVVDPLPVNPAAEIPEPPPEMDVPGGLSTMPGTLAQTAPSPAAVMASEATEEEAPEPTGQEIPPPRIDPGYAAAIFMVDGDLSVKREGDWETGELGMQLRVGHEIRTEEGRSKIILRGRGEVRLPPQSHLRIDAIDDAGLNVTLNLVRGSIWIEVEQPDTGGLNFNVQTPDLTAGVRGTVFNVQAIPDEGSRVSVVRGVVQAISILRPNQTARVLAGLSVFCDTEGNLSAPEPIIYDLQREWDEWDQWALEAHSDVAGRFVVGGDVMSGIIQQQAALEQTHATMVAEYAYNTNLNRQADFLRELSQAFIAYATDVNDLPPSNQDQGADGWFALLEDPGVAGWNGPYLPPTSSIPVDDGWGNAITYQRRQSPMSGNIYGELISNGPNGIYSRGQTDDIRELIRVPDEVQAAIQANLTP